MGTGTSCVVILVRPSAPGRGRRLKSGALQPRYPGLGNASHKHRFTTPEPYPATAAGHQELGQTLITMIPEDGPSRDFRSVLMARGSQTKPSIRPPTVAPGYLRLARHGNLVTHGHRCAQHFVPMVSQALWRPACVPISVSSPQSDLLRALVWAISYGWTLA